jgi:hydroxyethylthiazole kinase-like uncharacterized protein yjeF
VNFATALLNASEMAEADRLTVNAGTSVSALMEKAGRGVAQEVVRRWSGRHASVLCGPGNNGGDGFVAACYLANAGWNVRVALLGSRVDLKDAARQHAEKWRGEIESLSPKAIRARSISYSPNVLCAASSSVLWLSHMTRLQQSGNKCTRGHALISGGYPGRVG